MILITEGMKFVKNKSESSFRAAPPLGTDLSGDNYDLY